MTDSQDRSPWLGRSAERTVLITATLVDRFVELSGDSSPIHVSEEAAQARGFEGRVVHGMLLGALLSGLIGTTLPGEKGVLQNLQFGFSAPCRIGDEITISVWVVDHHESVNTLVLAFQVANQRGIVVAKGSIRSGLG